jgi:A/G-specific adenine glycosylase
MSAQTAVERAAERWVVWMRRWPTVESLAQAPLPEVLVLWQGLGYPRRARDLHRGARLVAADGWPSDLTALPGVGRYVAAAIRCFAHEEPVLPIDVNVARVLERRFPGGVDTAGDPWRAGQALMEFGQRVCRAARPACASCPVAAGCPWPGPLAPVVGTRPPRRRQPPYAGSLRERRGRLLRQVLADGRVPAAGADAAAAAGLIADGLLAAEGSWLLPPA